MKYYEDPILGKGRAADVTGGTGGGGGSSYVGGTGINIIGGTINATGAVSMTTANRMAFTPNPGFLIWDTDLEKLFVGDGSTAGGVEIEGGGGGGTPATVPDIMTGSGASNVLNVQNIRGALTAGQAVDVTSQPDNVTGNYKGTFSVTGSLGFASFPKFASGLTYLFIAKLTATTSGTVTPSATTSTAGATATATWLDGTTTAINLTAETQKSVAMLFSASAPATNCGASLVFSGTGSVEVTACRQYEVTACSSDAIAYIAALNNPDAFSDYYLVKRDMVSPWTYIIDMGDSPATTVAAGLAYQIKAMTGSHIITVDTCPDGYVGRETFVRIFVGQTGNVVVQSPLQLATPLVANAINNCHVSYRDGSAVLVVDDTVGGYVVDAASGTTAGTLYYGLTDSATEFISIPGAFDGIPVDLGGASVTTSGTAQKYVVGNGISNTIISGNLNAGAGKLNLSNLSLSDVGITGGTMTIPNGVVVSGTVTVSSGGLMLVKGSTVGRCEVVSGRVELSGRNTVGVIEGTAGTVLLSSGAIVDVVGNANPKTINPGTSVSLAAGTQTFLFGAGANVSSATFEHDSDIAVIDCDNSGGINLTNKSITGSCTVRGGHLVTTGAVGVSIYNVGTVLTLENSSATGLWLTATANRGGKLVLSGGFKCTGTRVFILSNDPNIGEMHLLDGAAIDASNLPNAIAFMNPVGTIVVGSNCTITSGGSTYPIASGTYTGSKTINKNGTIS